MNRTELSNLKYRFYEPNQGLEELQAKIFNENNPSGPQPATAEQIKQRFEEENIDPQTVRYAFIDDDKMLSYIQARVRHQSKEIHLGFPWALEGCPVGVQDKLFDEMLEYTKKKYENYKIRVNINVKPKENVDFIKKRGFIEKNRWLVQYLDLQQISESEYNQSRYTSRNGTEKDLELLVDLIKSDKRYNSAFKTEEDIINYLNGKVIVDGHLVLVFEDDVLVGASAPLIFKPPGQDKENIILRFAAFRNNDPEVFKPLLIEVARECLATDYGTDKAIAVYTDSMDTPAEQVKVVESFEPKSEVIFYYFYLENNTDI